MYSERLREGRVWGPCRSGSRLVRNVRCCLLPVSSLSPVPPPLPEPVCPLLSATTGTREPSPSSPDSLLPLIGSVLLFCMEKASGYPPPTSFPATPTNQVLPQPLHQCPQGSATGMAEPGEDQGWPDVMPGDLQLTQLPH